VSLRVVIFAVLVSAQLSCASRDDSPSPDGPSASFQEVDLAAFFNEMEATFVLWQPEDNRTLVFNPSRAERRFIPASTFKIPNSVIALESGVVDDEQFSLPWDTLKTPPEEWWPASWQRQQTLETAFQNSVYWYYQEIARRIGDERMVQSLNDFQYGNRDISGGIDQFWLTGDIRISPFEQVQFLHRLFSERLPVSARTIEIIQRIMVIEETEEYVLAGKTGTANVTQTRELGWLVGYLETEEGRSYYALNIEGERVWEDWPPQKRADLVRRLLAELSIIPSKYRAAI